jgi:hypothetical protein
LRSNVTRASNRSCVKPIVDSRRKQLLNFTTLHSQPKMKRSGHPSHTRATKPATPVTLLISVRGKAKHCGLAELISWSQYR